MSFQTFDITAGMPGIRLMGRMDPEQKPLALDWTGCGVEFRFRGTDAWARLEVPAASPVMWMIVLADGQPITRFPVEPGIRMYPLLLGLDNMEWVTPWFTARGNYSWYACEALNAERSILSQSGWGVCWDYQHTEGNNMSDAYEFTVGVLKGPEAEARGCLKPWNFSRWQPDIVCIRLMTNDNNGIIERRSYDTDRETLIRGAMNLIRKVRKHNPQAKIVWILPGSDCRPELAAEAVGRMQEEGMTGLYDFTVPDYGPEDMGARWHPNAEYNRRIGLLLADFLKSISD